ncbi:MAG: glutamate synthase large subunit [Rikenellaceae bacterium]|nr:glutamate synthase large subunit [Rikenellaceae bacterium]
MEKNQNKRRQAGRGLYRPAYEHDACGVGLVVNVGGGKSHEIVESGLQVLEHMAHRGAEGADSKTGDGAGMMVQIPHEFILLQGIPVPEKGKYGVGVLFLPKDAAAQAACLDVAASVLGREGLDLLAVRDVPVNSDILGDEARQSEPAIKQLFITGGADQAMLDAKLYLAGKKIGRAVRDAGMACYIASLSTRTMVYKGLLTSHQLRCYFPDLVNPYFTSGMALVHSRFSTNTFPTWELAQPFRMIGHNGEINTIQGNRAWMQAREPLLRSEALGPVDGISPIVEEGMSDSASLDNVLEFLVRSGMSLPHALAMLVPESYNDKNPIPAELKSFYEYHSIWMEPWDGPATVMFSDGRYAGGMLDRNGLRPARYLITTGGMMVVASETGVMGFDASQIREKGRLRPGKILMVDTEEGRIWQDAEIKAALAAEYPYKEWLEKNRVILSGITSGRHVPHAVEGFDRALRVFGYSEEDIERIIKPMSLRGVEPIASMGNDTPMAVLSERPQRLFNYFRQQFAQVTNPPIDPLREQLVMSLASYIGAVSGNILEPGPGMCKVVKLPSPIITNAELDILKNLRYKGFKTVTLPMLFGAAEGSRGMVRAVDELCRQAERAVDEGYNYVVVSDRGVSAQLAPIPSLLALSAVHHHLIGVRKRSQIALIVESGEVCETMHVALLVGYGASAVNPYMAFGVLDDLVRRGDVQLDYPTAEEHYIRAINKGMLKVMSKMGISTIRSYRGAKLFNTLGIAQEVLDRYFGGGVSPIAGIGVDDIAAEALAAHARGFAGEIAEGEALGNAGIYKYRKGGEYHAWFPQTISRLQQSTRTGDYAKFKEYTKIADEEHPPVFLRDMLDFRRAPIDIDRVEPVEAIMRRFVSGAMSYGSISREAHEAIAVAMNRIGGRSNTGEGGEDPARYEVRPDGTSARSAIKQVASGRFGVNAEYLVNADEIQIKVAQGAKPGEGGQLPGFKVDGMIARTRHSIPGISLISPPPHHDIYSIEDLAQLIFDLKNVNPSARISVKLVSELGVGTVAAGVAKARADMILISGSEGGTGASPASSIRHAGMPPELGLAEVQQTLVLNNLRGKVALQVDGQLKTGRDVIVSALLGAEEFGFATSVMIVLGCVMKRECHLNTCPMGVATQDAKLRERFRGHADYLVNFFTFLAQEVREYLAGMGFERLEDIVGRTDLLVARPQPAGAKAARIDLSQLLAGPAAGEGRALHRTAAQDHRLEGVEDLSLIAMARPAIDAAMPVHLDMPIRNTDRSVGAMLSGEIARRYGAAGLPDGTIQVMFRGSAGQSFGAFLARGVAFALEGDANDYLGKGLSGGTIALRPPKGATFAPEENIIAGNTLLYGATAGEVYINGRVGERFCVRNSGAVAVVEGIGDHGCEYMTGGRAVILGPTGRNFAAGMSGGIAYVWNRDGDFDFFCNMEMVELSLVSEEAADSRELHALIADHYRYTASPLARRMLDDWGAYVDQFIKVMPIEYKKVLHDERIARLNSKIARVERDY